MERRSMVRLGVTIVLLASLFLLGRVSGTAEELSLENLQTTMDQLGWSGLIFFLAAFTVGELLYVPGIVFVAAAVLAYGPVAGGILGYVGAILSVVVSFCFVRLLGGSPLAELRWQLARRVMAGLDRRPILTVALLRLLLFLSPPLNYALALSSIRFRHYLVGSTIGLYFPVAGTTLVTHFGLM